MKKYISLIIVVSLLIVIIGGTYFLSKTAETRNFKEISYEDYQNLSNKKEESLVYFGLKEDTETLSLLKEIGKENKVSIKYVFIDELSNEEKASLSTSEKELTLVSKTLKDNSYTGEFSKSQILSYLRENELVAKEYISIGADEYLKLIKGKNVVVFIGASTCGYCTKFKPEVNNLINKYNVSVYYLELDKFSESDLKKIYDSASFFAIF